MVDTAEEILRATGPGEVFTGDIEIMKIEYSSMAKKWHPDLNNNTPESNTVMAKLNKLYKQGVDMLSSGKWIKPGWIRIPCINGKAYEIQFRIAHHFELGIMYVGNSSVAYIIDGIYRDLFLNAFSLTKEFNFANERMKNEVSRYLPKLVSVFETTDGQLGMIVKKSRDLFLLRDVLIFYDGKLPSRHVAWILSTLYNLACYLGYSRISHNAILPDTYFISPKDHCGAILGGWWYAVCQGSRMVGVPQITYSIMPPKVKDKKCGDILTDLELIRYIGRDLLGDPNGTRLHEVSDAPTPMIEWLRGAASGDALEEYTRWGAVLDESFGTRKFIDMNILEDELYSKVMSNK